MSRVFVFSLMAAFNPTLLAATTIMLLLDRPARLMLGYLLGAFMTSVTLGVVIVFSAGGSGAVDTTQHVLNPVVDVVFGGLALALALILRRRPASPRRKRRRRSSEKQPRWQRALSNGSPRTAFVIGALLTLPGASYLAGLVQIDRLGYSDLVSVLLVVAFNVIMLALLEIPLVGFALAPDRTRAAVNRVRTWISGNSRQLAVRALVVLGVLFLIKGVGGLVA